MALVIDPDNIPDDTASIHEDGLPGLPSEQEAADLYKPPAP